MDKDTILAGLAITGAIGLVSGLCVHAAKETQTAKAVSENRKPPIPHFRAAHWSHYWTGKGRTNCELRWIEPIFVCGDYDSSKNSDIIIHKID